VVKLRTSLTAVLRVKNFNQVMIQTKQMELHQGNKVKVKRLKILNNSPSTICPQ
jgi:hypothetical protein